MSNENLFAHTDPGSDYPAYISINSDNSRLMPGFRVTVRSAGNEGKSVGEIHVTPELLEAMSTELIMKLNGVEGDPAAEPVACTDGRPCTPCFCDHGPCDETGTLFAPDSKRAESLDADIQPATDTTAETITFGRGPGELDQYKLAAEKLAADLIGTKHMLGVAIAKLGGSIDVTHDDAVAVATSALHTSISPITGALTIRLIAGHPTEQ